MKTLKQHLQNNLDWENITGNHQRVIEEGITKAVKEWLQEHDKEIYATKIGSQKAYRIYRLTGQRDLIKILIEELEQ